MASFQAKIGWEQLRKRENKKKIDLMSFYPTWNREFQKNSKKIQKIKKHHQGISINSYPTRNRKFQKNSKNIKKIVKPHQGISSSQNKFGKAEKERK